MLTMSEGIYLFTVRVFIVKLINIYGVRDLSTVLAVTEAVVTHPIFFSI